MMPDPDIDGNPAEDGPDRFDRIIARVFVVAAVIMGGLGAWALFFLT